MLRFKRTNSFSSPGRGVGEGYILKLDSVPVKNCLALAGAFGATALQIAIDSAGTTGFIPVATDPTFTSVKAAGGQLANAALATACAATPGSPKAIYLWFAF